MQSRWSLIVVLVAAACSGPRGQPDTILASPDQRHLVRRAATTARSIEVASGLEVARADALAPQHPASFSANGAVLVARSLAGHAVALRVAGGAAADLGEAIDLGTASPDGSLVAFLKNKAPCPEDPAGRHQLCGELFVAGSEGGAAVRVAGGIRLLNDPDGSVLPTSKFDSYQFAGNRTLVFSASDGALRSVPADGSAAPVLLAPGLGRSPGNVPVAPIWTLTPDGGRVFFTDYRGLSLVDAAGGTPLLFDHSQSHVPGCGPDDRCAFSPDGKTVALISERTDAGQYTLKLAPLAGGPARAYAASRDLAHFDQDNRLTFIDAAGTFSVIEPTGEVRSLGASLPGEGLGAFSPDGRSLALLRPDHVGQHVNYLYLRFVSTATGASWQPVDAHGPLPIWNFGFSPDSSRLFLIGQVKRTNSAKTDQGGDLSVAPAAGGQLRLIEKDVDAAVWAGSEHLVVQRYYESNGLPAGTWVVAVE